LALSLGSQKDANGREHFFEPIDSKGSTILGG